MRHRGASGVKLNRVHGSSYFFKNLNVGVWPVCVMFTPSC